MNTAKPTLFDASQPRQVEVSGPDLPALLADLKTRGCIVLGMTSICVSRWRLSLDWSNAAKPGFRPPGVLSH
jgi:hypothetical protein